jgi:hypothetical protein
LIFVGRTHVNIILTHSRPMRGELLYSNSLFPKLHKVGKKSNRTTSNLAFIYFEFFVEMEIDVVSFEKG